MPYAVHLGNTTLCHAFARFEAIASTRRLKFDWSFTINLVAGRQVSPLNASISQKR